jgi:hypothetical protein
VFLWQNILREMCLFSLLEGDFSISLVCVIVSELLGG